MQLRRNEEPVQSAESGKMRVFVLLSDAEKVRLFMHVFQARKEL